MLRSITLRFRRAFTKSPPRKSLLPTRCRHPSTQEKKGCNSPRSLSCESDPPSQILLILLTTRGGNAQNLLGDDRDGFGVRNRGHNLAPALAVGGSYSRDRNNSSLQSHSNSPDHRPIVD